MTRGVFVLGLLGVAVGVVASASHGVPSSPPRLAAATLPPPCTASPIDLRTAKVNTLRAPGTLSLDDPQITRYFMSGDPRNFAAQLTEAETSQVMQGRVYGDGGPLVLVASFGSFDPLTQTALDGPHLPLGDLTTAGAVTQGDLMIEIVDATNGTWFGEGLILPGCHLE